MKISQTGLDLIKRFEGFSPHVYKDAAGHPTIGYGHLVKLGEAFANITEEEAGLLLMQDVAIAERAVEKSVKISLNQGQFDALVSFVYNIGYQAFEKSYLLRLLNAGNTEAAAEQFSRWIYAGGKRLPGLIARRKTEETLFLSMATLS